MTKLVSRFSKQAYLMLSIDIIDDHANAFPLVLTRANVNTKMMMVLTGVNVNTISDQVKYES